MYYTYVHLYVFKCKVPSFLYIRQQASFGPSTVLHVSDKALLPLLELLDIINAF